MRDGVVPRRAPVNSQSAFTATNGGGVQGTLESTGSANPREERG